VLVHPPSILPASLPRRQKHHSINAVVDMSHRKLINSENAQCWIQATQQEFGRLAQGLDNGLLGTDTIFFIPHAAKTSDRPATYCQAVADYNEHKPDPYHVRLTAGGDKVVYTKYVGTPTVDISTVKIHLNSVISTPDSKYMTVDLKGFNLNMPLEEYEYMRIPVDMIPQTIMDQYNLAPLVERGFVMVEIRNGIYGLPQAGILAYNLLCTW
jgi:hypothetical protein